MFTSTLELDTFILKQYDSSKVEHNVVLNKIEAGDPNKYLGNIKYLISKINQRGSSDNQNYIVYYNEYPIGYLSITYLDNTHQISAGIIPEFRRQNLAALLLEEFSDYCLENGIKELTVKINNNNIASQKIADLVGYKKVESKTYKLR